MKNRVLSSADIEQFMEKGWVKVEQAYPRKYALEAQQFLWDKLEQQYGVQQEDKSTWTEPLIQIRETYQDEVFQKCNTERLADAIEDLVGVGRPAKRIVYGESEDNHHWGWWPVNFALGADQAWTVPTEGWHWDGIHFRHYIDSKEQGLLCLCLFSDIGPKGGGTLVAEGSHKIVARFLQTQPDGIEHMEGIQQVASSHPWLAELTGRAKSDTSTDRVEKFMNQVYVDADGTHLKVVETTGDAGDVILCHPFLFHAASQNHSGVPRFMCNRTTPLKEKMNFNRSDPSDYSPLELSIKRALGH